MIPEDFHNAALQIYWIGTESNKKKKKKGIIQNVTALTAFINKDPPATRRVSTEIKQAVRQKSKYLLISLLLSILLHCYLLLPMGERNLSCWIAQQDGKLQKYFVQVENEFSLLPNW